MRPRARRRHVATSLGRHAAGPVPAPVIEELLERGRAYLVAIGRRPATGKHAAPRWWVE